MSKIKIFLMLALIVMSACGKQKELIPVYNEIGKQSQSTTSNKENEVQKASPIVNEKNEKILQELINLNNQNLKLYELLINNKPNEADIVEAEKRKAELQDIAVKNKKNELKLAELEKKLSALALNKSYCLEKEQGTWGDWTKEHSIDLLNLGVNGVRLYFDAKKKK
jgi:hypothetical protein